jgi:hypothetical protein
MILYNCVHHLDNKVFGIRNVCSVGQRTVSLGLADVKNEKHLQYPACCIILYIP